MKIITVQYPRKSGDTTEQVTLHLANNGVGKHTDAQIKQIVEHAFKTHVELDAVKRQLAVFGLTEVEVGEGEEVLTLTETAALAIEGA